MRYEEAKTLAESWANGIDPDLGGWRAVIAVLLQRINALEGHVHAQNEHMSRLSSENEALSLDLGLREKDFRLPDQPREKTIADIIRECERKG
jgi:hypothetical protein